MIESPDATLIVAFRDDGPALIPASEYDRLMAICELQQAEIEQLKAEGGKNGQ